jgi:hypothetical protein
VDHRTILDAASRLVAAGTPVTALSLAADLGVDDEELLEDIGDAVEELVDAGRLRRVETRGMIAGKPAPFPTITYEPTGKR